MQQLKTVLFAKFSKAFNQLFLQAIKLIAAFRQIARVDLIFQPNPLKNAASYSDVGVSALFSSSLGSPMPSQPNRGGNRVTVVAFARLANKTRVCFGIRNFVISSSLAMTRSTTLRHIWCSSAVTSSSFSTGRALTCNKRLHTSTVHHT